MILIRTSLLTNVNNGWNDNWSAPLAERYSKIYSKKYNNYIKNVENNTNIYKSALPKVWTFGTKPLFNQIGFGLSKPLTKIF